VRAYLALAMAFTAMSCAPSRELDHATRSDAVLNGTAAPGENQVFLLDLRYDNGNAGICSAVLISPRVLLTAAHCADPAFESGATSMTIKATNKPDDSMLMMSDMIPVTMSARHPMWNAGSPNSDYDLALLLLMTAPTNATPAARVSALGNPVGQQLKIVGYGRSSSDPATSGTRRSTTLPVTAATSATLSYGDGTYGICLGDSGGPSFIGANVAGIHSRGSGSTCGNGVDIRVDAFASFIDAFVTANDPATCAADGRCASGCTSPDPDCPCAADGTCNSTCGATDPDCRCVANGMCGASCGAMDPDCCGADGSCDAACGTADPDCRCIANSMCGAGCGTTDPDCCGMDGTCDTACGMSDPDCACVADSTCNATCGTRDPDCPCAMNGTCDQACGASDPDCRCKNDGRCDPSCTPTDPDCGNCNADGVCTAACGISDPDCLDDGQVCMAPAECWGGLCEKDARGFNFCTRTCSDDSSCLNDTTCQASVCRAKRDPLTGAVGGCSVAPWPLVVLLLAWRRRRR